jgi:hypothetical protein
MLDEQPSLACQRFINKDILSRKIQVLTAFIQNDGKYFEKSVRAIIIVYVITVTKM